MTDEEKRIEAERLAEIERLKNEDIKQETINNLKKKLDAAVDPKVHAQLKKEYKDLMADFVDNRPAPKTKEIKHRPAVEIANELRKINDGDINNRDYIVKSLEYRESYINEFGTDPWTDFSVTGSAEATAKTKKVATVLQTLIDENESPVEFRMKLESVLKDDANVISIIKQRAKKQKK